MSRAPVPKSTKDKKGGQAASTPVVTHEIIPGKFTDHDWSLMLEKDDGEDFIIDIRDEVIESAMTHIYCLYLEHQLLPYTISQAKDALLQIVEWRFLCNDEGETDTVMNDNWQPDDEPSPCITDCWAQGAVPKRFITSVPVVIEEPEPYEAEIDMAPTSVAQSHDVIEIVELRVQTPIVEAYEVEHPSHPHPTCALVVEPKKPRVIKKKHFGPLRSAKVRQMTESLQKSEERLYDMEYEYYMAQHAQNQTPASFPVQLFNMPASCHSLIKVQQNRPLADRDVKFDEFGNVIDVMKINPDKLPSHCVRVKYLIRDPIDDAKDMRTKALTAGSLKTRSNLFKKKKEPPVQVDRTLESRVTYVSSPTANMGKGCESDITVLPSSLIENIELQPGVIVKEGQRVRMGPPRKLRGKTYRLSDALNYLKPVAPIDSLLQIKTEDILSLQSPSIIHITDSPVVPPILPQPPADSNKIDYRVERFQQKKKITKFNMGDFHAGEEFSRRKLVRFGSVSSFVQDIHKEQIKIPRNMSKQR